MLQIQIYLRYRKSEKNVVIKGAERVIRNGECEYMEDWPSCTED